MRNNFKGKSCAIIIISMLTASVFPTTAFADFKTENGKTYYVESDGSYAKRLD